MSLKLVALVIFRIYAVSGKGMRLRQEYKQLRVSYRLEGVNNDSARRLSIVMLRLRCMFQEHFVCGGNVRMRAKLHLLMHFRFHQ